MIGLLAIAGITYLALNSAKKADKTQLNGVEKIAFPKGTSQAVKDLVLKMAAGENLEGLGWGGRRSAYYSRAGSYSRSYNAEQAEDEDRYPLTRAAKHLGLTAAAFKKGTDHADIGTSEWHHVGKYATRVDYWDVSEESEIYNSYKFWFGAMNKANKAHCMKNIVRIAKQMLYENLKPAPKKLTLDQKRNRKVAAIARRKKQLKIHDSIEVPLDVDLTNQSLKKLKVEKQKQKHNAAKERLSDKYIPSKSRKKRRKEIMDKKQADKYQAHIADVKNNWKNYLDEIDSMAKEHRINMSQQLMNAQNTIKNLLGLTWDGFDAFMKQKFWRQMDKLVPIDAIPQGRYSGDTDNYLIRVR